MLHGLPLSGRLLITSLMLGNVLESHPLIGDGVVDGSPGLDFNVCFMPRKINWSNENVFSTDDFFLQHGKLLRLKHYVGYTLNHNRRLRQHFGNFKCSTTVCVVVTVTLNR